MKSVIKRGVITPPVTNRTAATHLKGVVLQGCDSNAFTQCGCNASQQLAAKPVRWLTYWRLLLRQLLLLSTAAAARTVAGGATGVEKVCLGRNNEVIGRACIAAVEAVVEGAEVIAAAFRSPSTFMLLEVSIRGVSRTQCVLCVIPRQTL